MDFKAELEKAFDEFKFEDFHVEIIKIANRQIILGYYKKRPKRMKNFYQLSYQAKKQKLAYLNAFDHVQCITTDTKWGNFRSALNSLCKYDWNKNNAYANKIMNKDPKHYFEMILFSIFAKRTLAQKAINEPLVEGEDYIA